MRLIRSRSAEFGIDPHRVGILGFSAGGAVASLIAYTPGDGDPSAADPVDRLNGRPDFQMLVYPGGQIPDDIPATSPPTFLLVANDDDYGCDKVALAIYQKLRAVNVPVEAIFLAKGRHAFNMGDRSKLVTVNTWPSRMADWLTDSGFLAPATK
jgi:acetyl esterase/lipase